MTHSADALQLKDRFTKAQTSNSINLKVLRIRNIIEAVRLNIAAITDNSVDVERLKIDQLQLNQRLNELSSIFYESTNKEQHWFMDQIMWGSHHEDGKPDENLSKNTQEISWNKKVEKLEVTDQNNPTYWNLDSWSDFNKLPHSSPSSMDGNHVMKAQVMIREQVLLAFHGVQLGDIVFSLRKKIYT